MTDRTIPTSQEEEREEDIVEMTSPAPNTNIPLGAGLSFHSGTLERTVTGPDGTLKEKSTLSHLGSGMVGGSVKGLAMTERTTS